MIKTRMSNEEEIIRNHKKYFEDIIKPKIDKVKSEVKNDDIRNFLEDFLTDDNINKISVGSRENIKNIIDNYHERYLSFSNCKYLKLLIEYREWLDNHNTNNRKLNKEERYKMCIELVDGIDIISSELNEEIKSKKEEFTNKEKIRKIMKKIEDEIESSKKEDTNEIIKEIFDYDKFSNENKGWCRHELISMMDIRACPYCNRQYITNYEFEDKNKTTADLDHFYIKSEYPYLALSLYNFIPSCQICNSRCKGSEDFYKEKHVYPFSEVDNNHIKFSTDFDDKNLDLMYLFGESDKFKIDIINNGVGEEYEAVENSIETFKLKEVYQTHTQEVKELIKKISIYNDFKIGELSNIKGLFDSEEEVRTFVFGDIIFDDNLSKRPLSKLMKDVYNEFIENKD